MLVRKYVGRKLADYYAQPSCAVVGTTTEPLHLSSLLCEWHWKRVFKKLYHEQMGQWLTPVELFQPHYSRILSNFLCRLIEKDLNSHNSVEIFELGGGRGTNAKVILDNLRHAQPDFYDRVSYTIVDSSPTLLQLQYETISRTGHSDRVTLVQKDLLDVAEGAVQLMSPSKNPTILLALELLDNLPHDKIRISAGNTIEEAHLVKEGDSWTEEFVPISDPLITHVVQKVPNIARSPHAWIPTVAYSVLRQVHQMRPQTHLVVADFDWLPHPDLEESGTRRSVLAKGEPLITSMEDKDYECYLKCPEMCDILFPTDFTNLAAFVRRTWTGCDVRVEKQASFLLRYGEDEVKRTESWLTGYSPLVHDFGNCSVLTMTTRNR